MKHLVQTAGGLEKLWGDTTATEQWSGDGQYDLLAGELKAAEADRDALRAENERLREALRFYANQDNWRNAGSAGGFDDDGVPAEWDEIPQSSACAENQGATARAALGEITNGISHAS